MAINVPSASEVVTNGEAIYNQRIRSIVEPDLIGQFVAIDTVTGSFETGSDHYHTAELLKQKYPNAIVCTLKIGYPATIVIGGRLRRNNNGLPE